MWKKKILDGSEIGLPKSFTFARLGSLDLPRLTLDHKVVMRDNKERATLHPTGRVGGGGHSLLTEYIRTSDTSDKKLVLLKQPKEEDVSFRTEAVVQWLSQKTLAGLGNRIAPVYELVELPDGLEGFTMLEFSNGVLCSKYLQQSAKLNKDILHVLAQSAILLQVLEDAMSLDHRDMKADNLLILPEPSVIYYTCSAGGTKKRYALQSPFTVAIVDFGFACLGGGDPSLTEVDAGEDTLPPLDPCPKDGRDLFHLIVSLYGIEGIRNALSPTLRETFVHWMELRGKPCAGLAERWSHSEWIYLLTSRKEFNHPSCTPRAILEKIHSLEPDIFIAS